MCIRDSAKAMGAAVTMNPASVVPGEVRTVEWRGQPVWVMRLSLIHISEPTRPY